MDSPAYISNQDKKLVRKLDLKLIPWVSHSHLLSYGYSSS